MKIAAIIAGFLVLLQFISIKKNDSSPDQKQDIFTKYSASDSVKIILERSCYDCHSNHTTYPWYSKIQPLGLWLNHHVNEGKQELNFSEFASYPAKKAKHKFEEIIEQVKEKEMPIKSYTLIHKDAKLTDKQRQAIINWAESN